MNSIFTPLRPTLSTLSIRNMATVRRQPRTPEWHTLELQEDEEDAQNNLAVLKSKHRLLKKRLADKNTVTSFRSILVEKTIAKRV